MDANAIPIDSKHNPISIQKQKNFAWEINCGDLEDENMELFSKNIEKEAMQGTSRGQNKHLAKEASNSQMIEEVMGSEDFLIESTEDEEDTFSWMRRHLQSWSLGQNISDQGWSSIGEVEGLKEVLRGLVMYRLRSSSDNSKAERQVKVLQNQLDDANQKIYQLDTTVRMKTQDIQTFESKVSRMSAEARDQRKHWLEEKDNLEKKCLRLQNKDSQYQANLRKQEQEYTRLQERMQKLTSQGDKGNKRLFDMPRPLNQIAVDQSRSRTFSQGFASKAAMASLEKMEQLQLENAQIREMLHALQKEFQQTNEQFEQLKDDILLRGQKEDQEISTISSVDDSGILDLETLSSEHYSMPAEWLELNVGEAFHRNLLKIQEAIARIRSQQLPPSPEKSPMPIEGESPSRLGSDVESVRMLKKELRQAHKIIQEQDVLIQEALFGHSQKAAVAKDDETDFSRLGEMEEELHRERASLAQQQQALQAERATVQLEAQQLADDQLELEKFRTQLIYGELHSSNAGSLHSSTPLKTPRGKVPVWEPLATPLHKNEFAARLHSSYDSDLHLFSPMQFVSPVKAIQDNVEW